MPVESAKNPPVDQEWTLIITVKICRRPVDNLSQPDTVSIFFHDFKSEANARDAGAQLQRLIYAKPNKYTRVEYAVVQR